MKKLLLLLLFIPLVSFGQTTFKVSKDIYYPDITIKIGEERWLAASFGLGAGKSTSLDTSSSGYMVNWTVYVEGNYGKTKVNGYSCEYTF